MCISCSDRCLKQTMEESNFNFAKTTIVAHCEEQGTLSCIGSHRSEPAAKVNFPDLSGFAKTEVEALLLFFFLH